jgi:hypothetical protein
MRVLDPSLRSGLESRNTAPSVRGQVRSVGLALDDEALRQGKGRLVEQGWNVAFIVGRKAGEAEERARADYFERNARIAAELIDAGLFPEGDINAYLRTMPDLAGS